MKTLIVVFDINGLFKTAQISANIITGKIDVDFFDPQLIKKNSEKPIFQREEESFAEKELPEETNDCCILTKEEIKKKINSFFCDSGIQTGRSEETFFLGEIERKLNNLGIDNVKVGDIKHHEL